MTSTRPYLLRALHEWMLDNQLTPQLVVDAQSADVHVPRQFVQDDGRITLNVSTSAVRELDFGNDQITFSARFSGRPFQVLVPVAYVVAIVARENGAGMSFPPEAQQSAASQRPNVSSVQDANAVPPVDDPDPPPSRPSTPRRGHLKVVK